MARDRFWLKVATAPGNTIVWFVRSDVTRFLKLLRVARMAGLVKLRCGDCPGLKSRLWAVHDACNGSEQAGCSDAEIGSKEPNLHDAAMCMNEGFWTDRLGRCA